MSFLSTLLLLLIVAAACSVAYFFLKYRLPPSPNAKFFSKILVGHRGVMSEKCDQVAENTISAAKYAYANGADAVEIDIMLSKDEHPIVFHDPVSLDRVARPILDTNTKLLTDPKELPVRGISKLTLEEIKRYEFHRGPKHERIPTFHEFLDAVNDDLKHNNKRLMIEVKEYTGKGKILCEMLAKVFEKNPHMYQSAVVASFSPFVLYNVRKLNPKIVTLLIVKRGILQIYSKEHIRLSTLPQWVKSLFVATVPIWDAIMFWSCTNWVLHFLGVGVISFEHEFISEDLSRVSKFQKRGYQVNVWAVNDERDRKMLLDLGVAVTTDWF